MSELEEGVKLRTIFWSDTDGGEVVAGQHGCKSLTVVMEHGQMSMVPWCLQVNEDGKRFMHNLALCEGAVLEDDDDYRDGEGAVRGAVARRLNQ